MAEYGLTEKGPNIKRLDDIINEMHEQLTEKWGIDTRQNPDSFLSQLITITADKLAELWELGESIYYSMYPSSAEGVNLDNVAQYGGITRQPATKSFYPIHCTGVDGTILDEDTMIESVTNPIVYLSLESEEKITRSNFNKIQVKTVAFSYGKEYQIKINDSVYNYKAEKGDSELDVLANLANQIKKLNNSQEFQDSKNLSKYDNSIQGENSEFIVTIDEEEMLINIEAKSESNSYSLDTNENMTTETVTTIITFGTVDKGDILLAKGSIKEITQADSNLYSVINLCNYQAGNNEETDSELRQSYIDKIFNRSSGMTDSIKSNILNNVDGTTSVSVFENYTDETDEFGRPPHSIEVIVSGVSEDKYTEIAQQILNNKAAGINTYGNIEKTIKGINNEDIVIRFSVPNQVYVWFEVTITKIESENLTQDYEDVIKKVILENINKLATGEAVKPQQYVSELYDSISGAAYFDIKLFSTTNANDTPKAYLNRSIKVSSTQRAVTSESMITVKVVEESDE